MRRPRPSEARRVIASSVAGVLLVTLVLPLPACDRGDPMFIVVNLIAAAFLANQANQAPTQALASLASTGTSLYLGESAHNVGALGTTWRSDGEVYCIGPDACTFSVEALLHTKDNSTPAKRDYTLPAGRALRFGDQLKTEFGVDGKAALRINSSTGRLLATSRTYNLLGDGNQLGLPAGATFGQYVPAVRDDHAIAAGQEGRLVQLEESSDFRTNLGLVNVTGVAVDVEIELFTANGASLGTVTQRLVPYEFRQITRIFGRVTSGAVSDGYAVVRTSTEGGRFLAQASVVDNLTGDPVFVPAARADTPPATAQAATTPVQRPPRFIAAAAHLGGTGGTNWRTDLELHNRGAATAQVVMELLPRDHDNSSPVSRTFTLAAGESRRFADVLRSEFGFNGAASLRLTSAGDLIATSRTYNLLAEGNELGLPAGATFGQYIPALTPSEAVHGGDEGVLIQLAQNTTTDSGTRTNLILQNAGTVPVTVDVELFKADGSSLGSLQRELAPLEYQQLNKVFTMRTSADVADGYAVVSTATPGGAFFALASVIDNTTGDPVGMTHARVQPEGADGFLDGLEGILGMLGRTNDEGEAPSLEDAFGVLVTEGLGALLDGVAEADSRVTRTAEGLRLDLGTGFTGTDGHVYSGSGAFDASGLSVTTTAITGTLVEDRSAIRIDGQPSDVPMLSLTLDLDRDESGRVDGTLALSGGAAMTGLSRAASASAAPALAGSVTIDTAICASYPTGGEITYTANGYKTVVTLGSGCDGTYSYTITKLPEPPPPGWDFDFSYGDPRTPEAQQYVVSATNAEVAQHPYSSTIYGWVQALSGADCVATPPGVITYRFDFPEHVEAATLLMGGRIGVINAESWGRMTMLASTDGASWELLLVCGPLDSYTSNVACEFSGALPAAVLGAQQLWLRVELCSWGNTRWLDPPCFLAAHSYWKEAPPSTTFRLRARFATQ